MTGEFDMTGACYDRVPALTGACYDLGFGTTGGSL